MKDTMLQTVETIINYGVSNGIGHLWATDEQLNLPSISINEQRLTSFVFCDYLGLSQDKRLVAGATEMMQRYGLYTAVSRAFLGLDLTRQTEEILQKVF